MNLKLSYDLLNYTCRMVMATVYGRVLTSATLHSNQVDEQILCSTEKEDQYPLCRIEYQCMARRPEVILTGTRK